MSKAAVLPTVIWLLLCVNLGGVHKALVVALGEVCRSP